MNIIGVKKEKVRLSSYNPAWQKLYEKEKEMLLPLVKRFGLGIEHVGSTSIPGAKAKPIIDIAIGVKNLEDGKKFIKPLELLNYEYKHDAGVKGRHYFCKGGENETCHVHIEEFNGAIWKNQVDFRNYLIKHKEALEEYNKLKESLAKEFKDDRREYTVQKEDFIKDILDKIRL